jgi:hypothetical protein
MKLPVLEGHQKLFPRIKLQNLKFAFRKVKPPSFYDEGGCEVAEVRKSIKIICTFFSFLFLKVLGNVYHPASVIPTATGYNSGPPPFSNILFKE